jgi:Na+-translocating ferredoxin:NAD+ oxidoreductase RnfC subunit
LDEANYLPEQVRIPLQQHIGAPAQPVVGAGDLVKVGDLVAVIPDGKLGANVHASIAGKVSRVGAERLEIVGEARGK